MADILGYARARTGDQDIAGQTMRLTEVGAIKTFTDVMSGRSMDRPGLTDLLTHARSGDEQAQPARIGIEPIRRQAQAQEHRGG